VGQPPPTRLSLPLFPVRATYVLLVINVLIYFVTATAEQWLYLGALQPALILIQGQGWRLLTSGFLHWNLLHIVFNMYALYGLGRLLERFFGLARFLGVYFTAMWGSSILALLLMRWDAWGAGASGAILGVLGALVVYYGRYRDTLVGGRDVLNEMLRIAVINFGLSLLAHVSLWGHVGGFIGGAMAGYALYPRYRYVSTPKPHLHRAPLTPGQWVALALSILLWGALLGVGFWVRV
jgi:membrane associated rhomboid family serine protease